MNKIGFIILRGFMLSYLFLIGNTIFSFFVNEEFMSESMFLYYVGTSVLQGLGLSVLFHLIQKFKLKNANNN